jgi:transcriptional regulator with XRE-family HTH domain
MTSAEFKRWREHMGWSQQAAANALGISKPSVEVYEHGRRLDDGRNVVIPRAIELACAALALGIRSYNGGTITIPTIGSAD